MGKHAKKSPQDLRQGTYDVGYGKPPTHTRWSKGMSGNPSGKRKRPKSAVECLGDALSRKVRVRVGGKMVWRSLRELSFDQLAAKMASGDLQAIKLGATIDPYFAPVPEESEDLVMRFTLKLEDDDPRPGWQLVQQGRVIDQG